MVNRHPVHESLTPEDGIMTNNSTNSNARLPLFLGVVAILILAVVISATISANGGAQIDQLTIPSPALTEPQPTPSSAVSPAPKDPTLAPMPPTVQTPVFPTGIFEGGEGVFRSTDVTIYNRWQGYLNGQPAQVFAGAVFDDPEQGVIIALLAWPDGTVYGDRDIVPASGPLQIVSEENLRLVISSGSGTTYFYDIPGLDFVVSLNATPLPTVTRIPTAEPSIPPPTSPSTAYP